MTDMHCEEWKFIVKTNLLARNIAIYNYPNLFLYSWDYETDVVKLRTLKQLDKIQVHFIKVSNIGVDSGFLFVGSRCHDT